MIDAVAQEECPPRGVYRYGVGLESAARQYDELRRVGLRVRHVASGLEYDELR